MASDVSRSLLAHAGGVAALLLVSALALAAEQPPVASRTSYTCNLNGKKLVSDRVIPECYGIEQRELNADGSLKRIVKPPQTPDEREADEIKNAADKAKISALNDAIRRDRNLMQRFPDEAAHQKAREKALDDARISVKNSNARIALLLQEKKKLEEEKKFYVNERVNKPLPTTLKQRLDATDASLEAQQSLTQNAQNEVVRINALYDAELLRLKKLWAGAPAGSLGPLPDAKAPAAMLGASKPGGAS
jgi:hypothetical protein